MNHTRTCKIWHSQLIKENKVNLSHHNRFQSSSKRTGRGFHVEYYALKPFTSCGGNYSNTTSLVTSPLYPNPYPDQADCTYLISQPNGTYITISFLKFDIICHDLAFVSDYIEMRDGISEDTPLMGKFCGNSTSVPRFMQTTQNNLWIR